MKMGMDSVQCETFTGLSAYGYLRLAIRTFIASVTASFLIVLLVFEERIAINLLMLFNPEFQILFVYVLGILAVSNLLSMLAISLD